MDDTTRASDPGAIALSPVKLAELEPWLFRYPGLRALLRRPDRTRRYWHTHLREHLLCGDSRAAVVLSTGPLLVAAYTDELDLSVVLRFPDGLAGRYGLEPGSRLLTVNTYVRGARMAADLRPGPGDLRRYVNYRPLIADFLTEDLARVEGRRAEIGEPEWQRAERSGREYLDLTGGLARDGRPTKAVIPVVIGPGTGSV